MQVAESIISNFEQTSKNVFKTIIDYTRTKLRKELCRKFIYRWTAGFPGNPQNRSIERFHSRGQEPYKFI